MKTNRKLLAGVALMAAVALAGCWHDEDDEVVVTPPAATEVPDSAGASGTALVNYIMTLGLNDETSEPLIIRDTFLVPADDTGDPAPLT